MHPGAMAARRATAEQRLTNALTILAERTGITPTLGGGVASRDRAVRDLHRLEALAGIAERLAGVEPLDGTPADPATRLTADDLIAARVREVVKADDEMMAAILIEVHRPAVGTSDEPPKPLRERLLTLKGIGAKTADKIEAAVAEAGVTPASDPLPGPVVGG